jgi:hypothetical protein
VSTGICYFIYIYTVLNNLLHHDQSCALNQIWKSYIPQWVLKCYAIECTIFKPDIKGILRAWGGFFGIQNPFSVTGVTEKKVIWNFVYRLLTDFM